VAGLLWAAPAGVAFAQACSALSPDDALRTVEECPLVFGATEHREANRSRRKEALHAVWRSGKDVNVTHTARWKAPVSLGLRSLELVGTEPEGADGPVACVRVSKRLATSRCPAGVYPVSVDTSLGAATALLAVVDGVALVEHAGRLATLSTDTAPTYIWRVSWRSSWRVARPTQPSRAGGSSRPRASSRPARSSRKPRPSSRKR